CHGRRSCGQRRHRARGPRPHRYRRGTLRRGHRLRDARRARRARTASPPDPRLTAADPAHRDRPGTPEDGAEPERLGPVPATQPRPEPVHPSLLGAGGKSGLCKSAASLCVDPALLSAFFPRGHRPGLPTPPSQARPAGLRTPASPAPPAPPPPPRPRPGPPPPPGPPRGRPAPCLPAPPPRPPDPAPQPRPARLPTPPAPPPPSPHPRLPHLQESPAMSTRPIGAAVRQRAARFGIAAAALTLG